MSKPKVKRPKRKKGPPNHASSLAKAMEERQVVRDDEHKRNDVEAEKVQVERSVVRAEKVSCSVLTCYFQFDINMLAFYVHIRLTIRINLKLRSGRRPRNQKHQRHLHSVNTSY